MKRFAALFMAVLMLAVVAAGAGATAASAAEETMAVTFNGAPLVDEDGDSIDAVTIDGSVYVPMDLLNQAYGLTKAVVDEESNAVVINDYASLFSICSVYDAEEDTYYGYRLYVPAGYDKEKSYPMVVALHGGGNRGTDNVSQLQQIQAQIWVDMQLTGEIEDVIVLAPQQNPKYGFFLDSNCVMDSVNDVLANYNIDKDRIYLTGSSMGGMGCWSTAAYNTDVFAAFLGSAGVYPDSRYTFPVGIVAPAFEGDVVQVITPEEEWTGAMQEYAERLKDFPIWMFQSRDDAMAPVSYTEYMEQCMDEVGATNCTFTYFDGVAHGDTYKTVITEYPEALQWLLEQHK